MIQDITAMDMASEFGYGNPRNQGATCVRN